MIEQIREEEFAAIVQREFRRNATPEEVAYLQAHPFEWRAELVTQLKRAEGHIERLQESMNQDVLNEHTFELETKITKAKRFVKVIQAHLAKINPYIKSFNIEREKQRKAAIHERKEFGDEYRKAGYLKGWGHAIRCFNDLMKEGYTQEQAFLVCSEYGLSLTAWKQSAEPMEARPDLPNWRGASN